MRLKVDREILTDILLAKGGWEKASPKHKTIFKQQDDVVLSFGRGVGNTHLLSYQVGAKTMEHFTWVKNSVWRRPIVLKMRR